MSTRSRPERVGLFGGTFDPIHLGHTFVAERAREALSLDRVVFLPALRSPFKTDQAGTPAAHRLAMVRLAIGDLDWAEVSDHEIARGGEASYSWETAEHFREELGGAEGARLFWILGADQWNSLDGWARVDHLAELVEFIVLRREGESVAPRAGFREHLVEGTFDASSTGIRGELAEGQRPATLDPCVCDYALRNELYAAAS